MFCPGFARDTRGVRGSQGGRRVNSGRRRIDKRPETCGVACVEGYDSSYHTVTLYHGGLFPAVYEFSVHRGSR